MAILLALRSAGPILEFVDFLCWFKFGILNHINGHFSEEVKGLDKKQTWFYTGIPYFIALTLLYFTDIAVFTN